jgi:hypothetical protein
VIAAQVQGVIDALASGSFSTAQFLKKLDPCYNAIERPLSSYKTKLASRFCCYQPAG